MEARFQGRVSVRVRVGVRVRVRVGVRVRVSTYRGVLHHDSSEHYQSSYDLTSH